MICRKCGAELPDNAIRCNHCGIKVNMYCPHCQTLNPFGTKFCKNCGFELIKICPSCGASNMYSVQECRKCHTLLNEKQDTELSSQNSSQDKTDNIKTSDNIPIENNSPEQIIPEIKTTTSNNSEDNEEIENPPVEKFDSVNENNNTHEKAPDLQQNEEQNTPPKIIDDNSKNEDTNTNYEPDIVRSFSSQQAAYLQLDIDEITDNNDITTNNQNANEMPVVDENIIIPDEEKKVTIEKIFNVEEDENNNLELKDKDKIPENNINSDTKSEKRVKKHTPDENKKPPEKTRNKKREQNSTTTSKEDYGQNNCNKQTTQCNTELDVIDENIEIEPIEEIIDIDIQTSLEKSHEEETSDENTETFEIEIQEEAVRKIINIFKTSICKHVIAVNGAEGSGKSAVLKQVNNCLCGSGYISLYGSCTPLVQITSFGFFQDAFLRMMGFPPFTNNIEAFTEDFKKSNFSKVFNFLDNNELNLFLNIFYPSLKDDYENILENKKLIFSILEKIIKAFLLNSNLIISIDNFELIDGASYDFLIYMLQKGYFNNRLKLLVAYQDNKIIQSYFDCSGIDENIFETILIKKFGREDLIQAVNKSIGIDIENILNKDFTDELIQKSDGNAVRMEQEIALLFDTNYITVKDDNLIINEENKPKTNPVSFEELIKLRLNSLTPGAQNVLFMAAIMGYRFAVNILNIAVSIPVEKSEKIIEFLTQELFITRVDNYTCEFKSLTLWKLIYKEAKSDLLYKENSQRLYYALKPLILSSNLQKLISCTEALNINESFLIWQDMAGLTAKLGDTNLYVIARKQCLKLLEEQEFNESEKIKIQIYEEIGKLLFEKSPKEAVTYLANVLDSVIKDSNIKKIINLSGYFVKSCYLIGNYFGANEAVDAVITALSTADTNISALNIALIKTRKLEALLNIGNSEQIINLVNEDIIPDIERSLYSKQFDFQYKNLIINAYLLSKIILAKAYALQGNNEVFKVTEDLRQFVESCNYNKEYYFTQINLAEAFGFTITGDINKSNDILNNISIKYKHKSLETNLLAEWNLINVINRVLLNQNKDLKADLFELAAFTNNINEHFMKNIIKLILGYVLKEEGNTVKALEIFNEEITYFAKEKVAIGALLAWALIVRLTISMGDYDKALNTAAKSLEIAQSPKINNYFFIIYFQKYIAEIYLKKGDLTAVKMYLEKSIVIAKQFDLKYQLIELYIAYGKFIEALMKSKRIYSSENVRIAADMYEKAVQTAKELKLQNMTDMSTRALSEFKTFCQLNSVELI